MKYKMNLGGSTVIIDVPHPLSVLRELDQMFSRAPTTGTTGFAARQQPAKRTPQPVIVITSDGVTTTATKRLGKKILASATAKCGPRDTYDFDEGARIAFERLCGRDPFPEKQKRPARPETYNGRMVCVRSPYSWWTVGKTYAVVDGRITADDGDVYPPMTRAPYRDAEDARYAGAGDDARHNTQNLFLPVDNEGRLLV